MIPKTTMETAIHQTCLFPLYMNKAAAEPDALERLKLVITCTFRLIIILNIIFRIYFFIYFN